jgi:hypothetical protein
MNCPIQEQTADGVRVGRCWFHLQDGVTCPRQGEVSAEVNFFNATGFTTLEHVMRKRKGLALCDKALGGKE